MTASCAGKATMALGGIALMILTGCAPAPVACPAIGWVNSLTVELTGQTSSVQRVQLCTQEGCAPGRDVDSSSLLSDIAVTDREGDTWTFETQMLSLEEVTIRALASDGSVVSEDSVRPNWKRVGGSEQCGGPSTALVTVTI